MTQHKCGKEVELAEIKQLVKSLSSKEEKVLNNWHDIRLVEQRIEAQQKLCEETQNVYNRQHEEIMTLVKEISECQSQLIKEIVKLNTTFSTLKYSIGIVFTIFGGVITFLIVELIKIV